LECALPQSLARCARQPRQGRGVAEASAGPDALVKVEEIDRLLRECDADPRCGWELGAFARIALNTGLRRSEVLGIDTRHIDWKARKVTIIDRKNGQDLTVPLNPDAFNALKMMSAK
jgi:integrase